MNNQDDQSITKSTYEIKLSAKWGIPIFLFGFVILRLAAQTTDLSASQCIRRMSENRHYIAERCLLQWRGGNNPDYVGRVYDAGSGELLVRRTFSTPVPELVG